MKEKDIVLAELKNSGTSWTRNPFFEENGYVIIKNLYDPDKLICPPPEKPGQYNYRNKNLEDFEHIEVEGAKYGMKVNYKKCERSRRVKVKPRSKTAPRYPRAARPHI